MTGSLSRLLGVPPPSTARDASAHNRLLVEPVPEGDTVWRTCQRLNAALQSAVLVASDIRWPTLADTDLRGQRTIEVVSVGKQIIHRLDSGWTLRSHLRMQGQWRIEHSGEQAQRVARRRDVRAFLDTGIWAAIGLRLGMLDLVRTSDERSLLGHLGPDVLGPGWDAALVVANLQRRGGPIGEALLDQRVLAGVGTFWASEMLFLERILPWTDTRDLSADQLGALVAHINRGMEIGKNHPMPCTTGILRRGEENYVHARSGKPCRRCGDTIRVAMIGAPPMQRTLFSCPTCQGGYAPNDDRRPQRPLGSTPGRTSAPGSYRRP